AQGNPHAGQGTSASASGASSAGGSTAVAYRALSAGTAGSAGLAAARLVGLLPPPLRGALLLICPQLTLVLNPACKLPLSPVITSTLGSTGGIESVLASTGGLAPWSMLPGSLLLLAGTV